ncbi:MAG: SulP family inorganic anion transporter, partial [Bacteroidota bacterium]
MKKNLFGFDFSHFKGDLFGGITAGIVALPLALAFGLQSGMGAAAGLYGAIFISFFAALFGGTNTQISGPTAPMTAVSMVVIAGIVAANEGNLEKALPAILIVFILSGLIQIVLGVIKVGKYIRYIPYPVVSGFMTGIGVIILITQLLPMLGYYPKEDMSFVEEFKPQAEEVLLERILRDEANEDILVLEDFEATVQRAGTITQEEILEESKALAGTAAAGVKGSLRVLGQAIQNINYTDLILGLITIFIIYGFKRITTKIPSTLVALLLVSAGAYFFAPGYRNIGLIPSGFPVFQTSIFSGFNPGQITPYLFTAVSLALLGAIDSLLTSIVADNMTKTKHNPNQELVGQGIGNTVAGFFGGIPG